jgi:hypothetical protein
MAMQEVPDIFQAFQITRANTYGNELIFNRESFCSFKIQAWIAATIFFVFRVQVHHGLGVLCAVCYKGYLYLTSIHSLRVGEGKNTLSQEEGSTRLIA